MIKDEIKKIIEKTVVDLQKEGVFLEFLIPDFSVDKTDLEIHGDYSTSVAFQLAKIVKKYPKDIAEIISSKLKAQSSKPQLKTQNQEEYFEKIEVAGGFINFFVSKEYLKKELKNILKQKEKFGNLKIGRGKINVEFISANPTGPLTLGNGRGGFCGDVLANVLEKAGHKIIREYYINDFGEQIKKLGHSVLGDEEAVYKGDYIENLAKKIKNKDSVLAGKEAAKIILKEMIAPAVKKMGIKFDVWFKESDLYKKGETEKAIAELSKKGLTYEKEGALWFSSIKFGDDKDRVLVKEDKEKTYFASDLAYLKNKIKRGFKKIIIFVGADHYGYVKRMEAAAEAFDFGKENLIFQVMQLVRLIKDGQEVRMSKREGVYVQLEELIDEVGLDVARFFFLTKSNDSHLNFDLNLAKEQSEKNPVYYCQYAYARINSILKKSKIQMSNFKSMSKSKCQILKEPAELNLIKKLIQFPEIIEVAAQDFQLQRIPQYCAELAGAFHKFYTDCRVISNDKKLSEARLALVLAAKIVLKNTLDLMGVSAPEKM